MTRCLRYLEKVCQVLECKGTYDWLFSKTMRNKAHSWTHVFVIGCLNLVKESDQYLNARVPVFCFMS